MTAIIHTMTSKKMTEKPPSSKAGGSWIEKVAAAPATDGRAHRLTKAESRPMPPGSTFCFEVSGGAGQVIMAARIPTATSRDAQFSLPPNLERAARDATGEVNWTSAIIALADFAIDLLEKTPGAVTITPDSNSSGEGKVCSRLTVEPGKKLAITLAAPLPGWHKKGRRRIGVPEDIRARIDGLIVQGSFTGVLLGLAQFSLENLRKNKKRLLVLPRNQG